MEFFCLFFDRLECAGYSFAYVAHFVLLRDVWIRTQKATVLASALPSTNLATYLPGKAYIRGRTKVGVGMGCQKGIDIRQYGKRIYQSKNEGLTVVEMGCQRRK